MKFLFQHRVTSDEISCDHPLQFDIKGAKFILYLQNKSILTNSYKLHIIMEGDDENQAYQKIYIDLAHFQNRLIFYMGRKILINELELILISQPSLDERDIFIQAVKREDFPVNADYFGGIDSFLNENLTDKEILALNHYVLASIIDIIPDKFRNLYMAIEDLLEKDNNIARCDKCGAELICSGNPKHGSKTYSTILKKDIVEFIDKINSTATTRFPEISGESVFKMRQKLFHSQGKKANISRDKLSDMVHALSLCILGYFEDNYNIDTRGGSAIKSTVGWKCWYKYKAINISEEFDLNAVPSLIDLNTNAHTDTYWINPDK